MTIAAKNITLSITTEGIGRLATLSEALGVSRGKLVECFGELTEEQARKIVDAKLPVVEARYEHKNKAATAKRREVREKLSKLSPEQIEALLAKAE